MRPSRRITLSVTTVLGLCLVASVLVVMRLDQMRAGAMVDEVLYLPSPKVLKRLSLGYDGLLADIYWTRAVQYFGGKHHAGAHQYQLLFPLLQITTSLDPHLTVAYEFGANFLASKPPSGAGMPQAAVELAEFGIRNNPEDWHLYYDLGFIYYMELKDYARAADAFARGSRVPNAHPFLKIMAAQMAQHSGELGMAKMMWATTYQSTADRSVKANAAAHLRALQVDEDVAALEKLVALYRDQKGRLPASFYDLQAAGMLRALPVDPLGETYELTPDGRIAVRDPDHLPFIEKGLPPGYVPGPPKFLPSDVAGS